MKLHGTNIFTGDVIDLTAYFTMEHSANCCNIPVMIIKEWDDAPMDSSSFVLSRLHVVEATPAEMAAFAQWAQQIPA